MAKTVEFFFDIASPYSYFAATKIEELTKRCNADLKWRPFLLGGVFKTTGNQAPISVAARGQYMLKDLQRWAAYYDEPFKFPSKFPVSSLLTMRALTSLSAEDVPTAALKLFRAYWVNDENIEDPLVVAQYTGAEAVENASTPEIKETLKQATSEAVERGAFGAPSLFVDGEMFFGNDRLFLLEIHLNKMG